MANTSFTATIDELTENADGKMIARLVFDDGQQLYVPATHLPEGASEGMVLEIGVSVDVNETQARRDKVRDLQRKLYG